MNKAVFLDRDGTINVEKNYLYKIEEFEFLPGVIEGMKLLQDAGFLLIIITNQSGIARGYYTEEDFNRLNTWMMNQFKEKGVNIAKVYYCPHLPDSPLEKYRKDCDCRKPKLGMFIQAVVDFDIDLSNSFAIGDKIRDCVICNRNCHSYLVGNNESPAIISDVKAGKLDNVKYAMNLLAAAFDILENN